MLILNGDELLRNPAGVILKAQSFLELDPMLTEQNFVFDQAKKFFCFQNNSRDINKCLGSAKGRTRGKSDRTINKNVRQKLETFYAPYNKGKWFTHTQKYVHGRARFTSPSKISPKSIFIGNCNVKFLLGEILRGEVNPHGQKNINNLIIVIPFERAL